MQTRSVSAVEPPIMNSPNSENLSIMNLFPCTHWLYHYIHIPLNKENLRIMGRNLPSHYFYYSEVPNILSSKGDFKDCVESSLTNVADYTRLFNGGPTVAPTVLTRSTQCQILASKQKWPDVHLRCGWEELWD